MTEEDLVSLVFFSMYGVILFTFFIAFYVYTSVVLQKIAQKLGYKDTWRAWVPIVKGGYQLEMGGFSPWLNLLVFLPFFGWMAITVLSTIAWIKITERRGFPQWIGLIVALSWLLPSGGLIAQCIAQGYIAWSEYEKK